MQDTVRFRWLLFNIDKSMMWRIRYFREFLSSYLLQFSAWFEEHRKVRVAEVEGKLENLEKSTGVNSNLFLLSEHFCILVQLFMFCSNGRLSQIQSIICVSCFSSKQVIVWHFSFIQASDYTWYFKIVRSTVGKTFWYCIVLTKK